MTPGGHVNRVLSCEYYEILDPGIVRMSDGGPAWHQLRDALEANDFSTASSLLGKNSGLIDERNGIGESILHFLAVEDHRPAVEWLHGRGANLNVANEFGTPLLFEVALLGYHDLLLWMIEHGADPGQRDFEGRGIVDYLMEFEKPEMVEWIRERGVLRDRHSNS